MIAWNACHSVLNALRLISHNASHAHWVSISLKLRHALLVLIIAGVVDPSDVINAYKASISIMANVSLNV